jgi:hypothetical protein
MDDLSLPGGAAAADWPLVGDSAGRVLLSGIDRSRVVDAALNGAADELAVGHIAEREIVLPRLEPGQAPPFQSMLWRLELASGRPLNAKGVLARQWHRRPYALTIRLVCYLPGSVMPEILDEATIGTTGAWHEFRHAVDHTAMRLVRDAASGHSRGVSGSAPAPTPSGPPGWLEHARRQWRDRLMNEWWSLGSSETPIDEVLSGQTLRDIHWYSPAAGERYLADPFPWFGTGMILCEDMPRDGGIGRIVSVTRIGDRLSAPVVHVLDDGRHHSYPCTLPDGDVVYCVPETTQRGGTQVYRLMPDGQLAPVAAVAPQSKLADPTLFRWGGKWWIACTDLDIGLHDNLCLLHAPAPEGPWRPHRKWPVKFDIRGARPAGTVFIRNDRLIRPAQDCAGNYGAGIALHEIMRLTETEFAETLIGVLRPDPNGPFPHGLHTLTHDGERFWVDGKRMVRDLRQASEKLRRKLSARRYGRKRL